MELDIKQLALSIKSIAEEKNLPDETVQEIVEQALAAAYRRDYGEREQEVRVSLNLNTGEATAYISKEVVKTVGDPNFEISEKDAKAIDKTAEIDAVVEVPEKVVSFGRVAAQTARQVILQRLREAEREIIMNEYEDKIGTLINGVVARVEGNIVRVDIGKAQGIMPRSEQIQGEHYHPGMRIKVFLKDVERGMRGPQLVVSRGSTSFIEWLFRAEVPEMENEAVEIKNIAREAGVRTKLSVYSSVQGVDPVGTFVGGHGTRVNAVMGEIGDQEKIDIIVWDEDPQTYIVNALSPTKVSKVVIDESDKKAKVVVPEDQLSIAIGKGGQNVRLASKLTGYEIDIANETEATKPVEEPEDKPEEKRPESQEKTPAKSPEKTSEKTEEKKKPARGLKKKTELESSLLDAIEEHGTDKEVESGADNQ